MNFRFRALGYGAIAVLSCLCLLLPLSSRAEDLDRDAIRAQMRRELERELYEEQNKESLEDKSYQDLRREGIPSAKIFIDSKGRRVRLEERLIWPADNQFKHILLNFRAGSLHYAYEVMTAKYGLGRDLGAVEAVMDNYDLSKLRNLINGTDSAPSNWLTAYETTFSNSADSMEYKGIYADPIQAKSLGKSCAGNDCIQSRTPTWRHPSVEYTLRLFGPNYDVTKEKTVVTRSLETNVSLHIDEPGVYWGSDSLADFIPSASGQLTQSYLNCDIFCESPFPRTRTVPDKSLGLEIHRADYADGSWIEAQGMGVDGRGRIVRSGSLPDLGPDPQAYYNAGFHGEVIYRAKEFDGRDIHLVYQADLPGRIFLPTLGIALP